MNARASKSRKGSAASYDLTRLHDRTFFTDKNLGLHTVPNALRALGLRVECKTQHFAQDTPDTEWLPVVGKRGWIILSKDKNLKSNPLEVIGLLRANTHSFLLTSGSVTGQDMANAFIAAMNDIQGIVLSMPHPLVASVWQTGVVKVQFTHDDLLDRACHAMDELDESKAKPKP